MSIIAASKTSRLGTKRTCRSCGTRFYDFDKAAPACPKCQVVFDVYAEPVLPTLEPLTEEERELDAELATERRAHKEKRRDDEDGHRDQDGTDED